MKKFSIGDNIFYPEYSQWGVVTDVLSNEKHEYLVEISLSNGHMIVPQDDIVHEIYDEKYNEYPVSTFMNGLRLPDTLGKKGKFECIIAVGGNEGDYIPHFHVFKSKSDQKSWHGGACIMFKENRYFNHGKHKDTLSKDQIEAMVAQLKSIRENGETWWDYLVNGWNLENPDSNLLPRNLPMPEYDYKTIKMYKEK